ncbi:MAG: hypothetical protein OHK0022_27110 [Roseiflexaceae bacterium]
MARFWTGINPWVRLVAGVALAVVVLSFAWYIGSPLLFDQRVDEAFPGGVSQTTTAGSGASTGTMSKPAASGDTMGKPSDAMADHSMDKPAASGDTMGRPTSTTAGDTMNKPAADAAQPAAPPTPEAVQATVPTPAAVQATVPTPAAAQAAVPTPAAAQAAVPTPEATQAAAPTPEATQAAVPTPEARTEPVALRAGSFGSMNDGVHEGEGRATLYQLPDGARLLRLEDFKVTNGPDLRIYLSSDPSPRDADALTGGDSVEIAQLKGNIGNQNYNIPADLDLARFQSVVIYCKRFHVLVSIAPLEG